MEAWRGRRETGAGQNSTLTETFGSSLSSSLPLPLAVVLVLVGDLLMITINGLTVLVG